MAKQEYDDFKKRGSDFLKNRQKKIFKIVAGADNGFRVLKTPKGAKSPSIFIAYAVHEKVGPTKAYLRCGKDPQTGKGKCILCDKIIPMLRKKGKESRAAVLEPKEKMSVQVAEVTDDGAIKGPPKCFTPSKTVADSLLSSIILSKKRDYLDHKRGRNLAITRTGTDFTNTRYGAITVDDDQSRVPDEIIDQLKPFDEIDTIPKYSEEKMKKAYYGEDAPDDAEDEDEEDEDDEPKSKSKKSKKDEDDEDDDEDDEDDDEDDDEEDEDEDDDEDDEPKSKKKKGKVVVKKKSKKDDDDEEEEDDDDDKDDDDDDDEDEEEDDEPKSKKKVKSKRK